MKKNIIISLGLILSGLILTSLEPTSFSLQIKMGFLGKICLIVGVIGFWLFVLLPYFADNKDKPLK